MDKKTNRLPEANFIYHTSCTKCGSSDANSVYDNGTSYCFSCGQWSKESGESRTPLPTKRYSKMIPLEIEFKNLEKRKISKDICRKYGYGYSSRAGQATQCAMYFDSSGNHIANKFRDKDKGFHWIGEPKKSMLFGQQLWGEGGKIITITEGEIDALSVAEAFDGKYPVVSIQNGAQSAKKSLAKELEWLNSFEKIYLWFDNDEAGRVALEECILLFPAGKVKIIQHNEYKDANDVLVNKGKAEVISTFYNAKEYRPDGIVTVEELEELVLKPVEYGLPWCFEGITKLTYGRRLGEVHLLGAGVSINY